MSKRKYNKPQLKASDNYKITPKSSPKDPSDDMFIVFSFDSLVEGFGFKQMNQNSVKSLYSRLKLMSKQKWGAYKLTPHEKGGPEGIPIKQINVPLPEVITPEIDKLTSIRFDGIDKRIIGLRDKQVFRIIYIDSDLSVYKH